jgi:O-antigen/teichoic acid export membrane protein
MSTESLTVSTPPLRHEEIDNMQSQNQTLAVKTVKNALWHISGFFVTTVLGLVVMSLVVNKIGIASFGLFGLITAVLAPLSLANLGFGEATVKYVSQYVHEGDLNKAEQYISTTFFMNLLVGLGGAIVIAVFGRFIFTAFFHIQANDLATVKVCLYLVAAGWFCNQAAAVLIGIPAAFQKYHFVAMGNMIIMLTNSVLILLFVLGGGGLIGYTGATVAGSFINFFYWYAIAKKIFPSARIRPVFYREVWRSSFHFGGWQTISQLGGIMAGQADKYLLGAFLMPGAVGIYNVALTVQQRAYSSIFTMSEVLFPAFSSLSNESLELKADALMKASWMLTVVAVCVIAPLIPLAHDLIGLWINGDIAREGGLVLQTLAVAGTLGSATNATYFFLLGTGRTRTITILSIITGVVTVIVSALVLPRFGLRAAGWSGIAAMIAQMAFVLIVLRNIFGAVLSWSAIVTSLHIPILIGLLSALLIAGTGHPIITTWPKLILAYVVLAALMFVATLGVNSLLPHGRERNAYMKTLIKSLLPMQSASGDI